MQQRDWCLAAVLVCTTSSGWAATESLASSLSFQGYSGLFNTPNALTSDYRTATIYYGDQLERKHGVPAYVHGHNYIFAFGLQENLELSGRVATDTIHDNLYLPQNSDQSRDLSVNLKYRLPIVPEDWFQLAVGVQDLGGQTDHFDSKYLVATKELGDFRVSAGVAQSQSRLGRMDGLLAGLEWRVVPWLTPIVEYDAADVNLGLRSSHQFELMGLPFRVDLTQQLYSSYNETNADKWFGLALTVPLGGAHYDAKPLQTNLKVPTPPPLPAATSTIAASTDLVVVDTSEAKAPVTQTPTKSVDTLVLLEQKLVAQGFEDIELAETPNQIHVRFENNVFNQNELDALGVVIGLTSAITANSHKQFHVVMKNQGLPVIAVRGDTGLYVDFLNYPCRLQYIRCVPEANVQALLQVWQPRTSEDEQLSWHKVDGSASRWLTPRLVVSPLVRHTSASEYGTLDSSLALRALWQLDLWDGAVIEAAYDKPLSTTRNYEKNEIFADQAHRGGWNETNLHQTFKLGRHFYNQTSLSTLTRRGPAHADLPDYYNRDRDWKFDGVMNNSLWRSTEGEHQWGLQLGHFEQQNYSQAQIDMYIGSYRWFNPDKNISWQISYGKFWDQDTGVQISNRYLLGDTDLVLTYTSTEVKTINFAIVVPLTPRKDWSSEWFSARGNDAWSLGVTSLVKQPTNYIHLARAGAMVDYGPSSLSRAYLNRDRLSVSYIKANLYRLRDAFVRYSDYDSVKSQD